MSIAPPTIRATDAATASHRQEKNPEAWGSVVRAKTFAAKSAGGSLRRSDS
jgi:hypothetical protein